MPDYVAYRKSISNELIDIKDRVRDFIDDAHWGEDGRYKEIILKECLRNHLPANIKIGTGFVMGEGNHITKQIDIIIYTDSCPLLFQKGEFIIAPKEAVLGIIEVKTKLTLNNLEETIAHSSENGQIVGRTIFNGIFSYEYGMGIHIERSEVLKSVLRRSSGLVNYICLGPDWFIKHWGYDTDHPNRNQYSIYDIKQLAFGYFIGNMVEDVYIDTKSDRLPDTVASMIYPIKETKEVHLTKIVDCN